MKWYECPHCGKKVQTESELDELGWHVHCPHCEQSFDTDDFEKRYVIALADDDCDDYEDNFVNEFDPTRTKRIYTFASVKELMEFEKELVESPESMWYWIVDAYHSDGETGYAGYVDTILSGAIDYDDTESLREYFEEV